MDHFLTTIPSIPTNPLRIRILQPKKIVFKDHQNLDDFAFKVIGLVEEIIVT